MHTTLCILQALRPKLKIEAGALSGARQVSAKGEHKQDAGGLVEDHSRHSV